jgi:mannan endo-1,4-beta-mannosidase
MPVLTRRATLAGGAALLQACARAPMAKQTREGFVAADGPRFTLDGAPYRYAGANIWYGAYLGAAAPLGNRDRLKRELDALKGVGVSNLRVLGSGELSPLKNSLNTAFRDRAPPYNETLLAGLDVLLAEMGAREMRAVLYLTNFWEWSGGMVTYLYWTNGGDYINMNDPAHPWPQFPDFSAHFYASGAAAALYQDYVRAVVTRVNTITGKAYRDDPAIMAWQLANEPRPGGSEDFGRANLPDFYKWIGESARFIKSLDPDHLVSTGNEGLKGCIELESCVLDAHRPPEIDYVTAHIWPQNWGWVDPRDIAGTFDRAADETQLYMRQHVNYAEQLGKPLVIEEFGFPRDNASYAPGSPTTFKDRFYNLIYAAVLDSARAGGPATGSNFWAWGGAGRAEHPDLHWRTGDSSYVGDPPHEPQGWYSVFDNDASTIAAIRAHAEALAAL